MLNIPQSIFVNLQKSGFTETDILGLAFLQEVSREFLEMEELTDPDSLKKIKEKVLLVEDHWPKRILDRQKVDLLTSEQQVESRSMTVSNAPASSGDIIPVSPAYLFNTDKMSPYKGYSGNQIEKIDPASGSLYLQEIDFTLPGKNGMDFVFARTYNSQASNWQTIDHLEYNYVYLVNAGTRQWSNIYEFFDENRLNGYTEYYDYFFSYENQLIPLNEYTGNVYGVLTINLRRVWVIDGAGGPVETSTEQTATYAEPNYNDLMYGGLCVYAILEPDSFLDLTYGIGYGWSLSIPAIQNEEDSDGNKILLHMGDGRVYSLSKATDGTKFEFDNNSNSEMTLEIYEEIFPMLVCQSISYSLKRKRNGFLTVMEN